MANSETGGLVGSRDEAAFRDDSAAQADHPVTAELARLERMGLPELPDPLPVNVIDSHTHLDTTVEATGLGVETLLAAAARVGVTRVVQIGCDVESSVWAERCAASHANVVAAVALHPNDAAARPTRLASNLAQIERLARSGGHVRAIGETGLDYFRTRDAAGQATQRESFAAHIAIAKRYGLTLAIHDRDAHADVLDVLDAEGVPERVVMHCFSGDADFARACLDRGAWLSFPGTVTFKPNQHLRDALSLTPLDRVLIETDAPYLTPVPLRGRTNASYLIPHTARFMAHTRTDDLETLCQALYTNATAAYGGPWGTDDATEAEALAGGRGASTCSRGCGDD